MEQRQHWLAHVLALVTCASYVNK